MDSRGWTLAELSLGLGLMGLVGASIAGPLTRHGERVAVEGAAHALESLLFRARQTALLEGAGEVTVESGPPARAILTGALPDTLRFEDWGVALDLGAGRSSATIRYGPDGLGRVASRTLLVRMGSAHRTVVISSYGRVELR